MGEAERSPVVDINHPGAKFPDMQRADRCGGNGNPLEEI